MEECICQTRRWFLIKLQGNLLQVGHMLYELISVDDRMEIEIHCDTYDEDLLNRFHSQTIPVEYADLLLTDMLG